MVRTRFALAVAVGALAATVAGAQEPRAFTLRFRDAAGHPVPFYQELKTDVKQVIKTQGQELPQSQTSTFYYAWTPLKEDAGRWTVRQKVEAIKMHIDISGNPINYDSTKPESDPGASPNAGLTDFFKNLVGSEFVTTLGPGYRVEKVEGKDAFIKKLGSASAQMEALLKKVMTDDAMKQMADPTANLLPGGPKKKGDTWEKTTSINLGPIGSYQVVYKFTYVDPDPARPGLDKIELVTVLMYAAPKDAGADGLLFKIKDGSKMASDPAGSKGVLYYNPARQRIEEATINIKLKGDLVVEIGGTETKVELAQAQTTTLKTRGISFLAPAGTAEPPVPADPPAPAPGPGTGAPAVGAAAPCAPPCRARPLLGRFLPRPCFPAWHR